MRRWWRATSRPRYAWLPHIGHFQSPAFRSGEPNIGELNYDYLFKRLDELKYGGWVGCEYRRGAVNDRRTRVAYKLIDRRPTDQVVRDGFASAHDLSRYNATDMPPSMMTICRH